jgi:hypothetical protein
MRQSSPCAGFNITEYEKRSERDKNEQRQEISGRTGVKEYRRNIKK